MNNATMAHGTCAKITTGGQTVVTDAQIFMHKGLSIERDAYLEYTLVNGNHLKGNYFDVIAWLSKSGYHVDAARLATTACMNSRSIFIGCVYPNQRITNVDTASLSQDELISMLTLHQIFLDTTALGVRAQGIVELSLYTDRQWIESDALLPILGMDSLLKVNNTHSTLHFSFAAMVISILDQKGSGLPLPSSKLLQATAGISPYVIVDEWSEEDQG